MEHAILDQEMESFRYIEQEGESKQGSESGVGILAEIFLGEWPILREKCENVMSVRSPVIVRF